MEQISKEEFIKQYKEIFNKLPEEFQNEQYSLFHVEYDEFDELASVKLKTSGDALYYDVVNYDANFNIDDESSGKWYRLVL